MHCVNIIVLKGGVGMDNNKSKVLKKQKKQAQSRVSIKAIMEAKVPSANYELSAKPACHSGVKYESG
jgi:hypothetical protein